jgi:hypothetical protein
MEGLRGQGAQKRPCQAKYLVEKKKLNTWKGIEETGIDAGVA